MAYNRLPVFFNQLFFVSVRQEPITGTSSRFPIRIARLTFAVFFHSLAWHFLFYMLSRVVGYYIEGPSSLSGLGLPEVKRRRTGDEEEGL